MALASDARRVHPTRRAKQACKPEGATDRLLLSQRALIANESNRSWKKSIAPKMNLKMSCAL
jgi:hypothetical protein